MLGVDYSSKPPGGTNIKNAGFDFACRYISHYNPKNITSGEFSDLSKGNVALVVVFEDGEANASQGHIQGIEDAQFALAYARNIGWPEDRPIYFAVDWDVSAAQMPTVGDYFQGVAQVLGLNRTGGYGGFYVIKYLFDNNLIKFGWQAYAWSRGNRDPRAHIFQRLSGTTINGTACDIDEALQADFGQNNGGDMTIDDTLARRLYSLATLLVVEGSDAPDRQPTLKEIQDAIGRDAVEFCDYLMSTVPYKDHWLKVKYHDKDVANAGGKVTRDSALRYMQDNLK